MSNEIIKNEIDAEAIIAIVGYSISVGDLFIGSYNQRIKIVGFKEHFFNGRSLGIHVHYVNFVHAQGFDESAVYTTELKNFVIENDGRSNYIKVDNFEEIDNLAIAAIANGNLFDEDTVDSKSLTISSGTSRIEAAKTELIAKQQKIEAVKRAIEAKVNAISSKIQNMRKQIRYTSRVLLMLQTFVGEYENILKIRSGEVADIKEPITIRQLVLWADEEIGDITTKNGQIGIDFKRLDDLDEWLATGNNFELFVPEKKCIVAVKISRQNRQYTSDPIVNMFMNKDNKKTYFLIRNGDNLYRLWAEVEVGDKLIPSPEVWEELSYEMNNENLSESSQLDLKEKELNMALPGVLIQGLLFRSEVFNPLPEENISVFDPSSFDKGYVRIIYDAESRLGDGHKPYKVWLEEMNSKITRGTRIYMGHVPYYKHEDLSDFFGGNRNWYPSVPKSGVYTVEEVYYRKDWYIKSEGKPNTLRILYNPEDTIYTRDDYHDRKNRLSFHISLRENWIMNYDDTTLEDVDYYISNRLERSNYSEMLPILHQIRLARMKERDYETHLVKMVATELSCDENVVWEAVSWWKTKTIAHRFINEDDAKAWRMIRRYINSKDKTNV